MSQIAESLSPRVEMLKGHILDPNLDVNVAKATGDVELLKEENMIHKQALSNKQRTVIVTCHYGYFHQMRSLNSKLCHNFLNFQRLFFRNNLIECG